MDHLSSPSTSSSSSTARKSKVGRRRAKDRNGDCDKLERLDIVSRGDVTCGTTGYLLRRQRRLQRNSGGDVTCSVAPETGDFMVLEAPGRNDDDDDAFEDHLSSPSTSSSSSTARKSKVGRRRAKDRNGDCDKLERPDIVSRGDVTCSTTGYLLRRQRRLQRSSGDRGRHGTRSTGKER